MTTHIFTWETESATQAFAERLAQNPLIRTANIQLSGDLGAGKSSFTRYLLRALGVVGTIKSPTYAVVEEYLVPNSKNELSGFNDDLNIWHFDFYRFNDPAEWEDAGFKDIFLTEGLKISEWSEKAKGYVPTADLHIDIKILDEDIRLVTVNAISDSGCKLVDTLQN